MPVMGTGLFLYVALLILALFDVLAGGLSKHQLALGVDVDLGNAQADGLCDHLVGDAGAAVQNQRNVVGGLVDAVQSLEVQTLPVCRVDTCCLLYTSSSSLF